MTERAQALEAAKRVSDWIERQSVARDASEYSKGWRVGAQQAVEEYRAALAVQPPPPVGSPTTEQTMTMPDVLQAFRNLGIDTECGACMAIAFTGFGAGEHTCKSTPVEPAGATQHDLDMELARERRDNDRMRELLKMQHPGPTLPDVTCEHGTAMDVHCCNCHSGFIFDTTHECPPPPVRHVATCETNGHVYGHTGACVFCNAPKPVDSIPEE